MPDIKRLNPDNVKIGENLRAAMKVYNARNHRDATTRLTWTSLAGRVSMHHVALSRAVTGSVGLSEEKILAIAEALGCHPGLLIQGASDRARTDRFPHIPAPTNRNKRDTAKKGMAVASVEALVKNPAILSSFFGGVAPEDLPTFTTQLLDLRDFAIKQRAVAADTNKTK